MIYNRFSEDFADRSLKFTFLKFPVHFQFCADCLALNALAHPIKATCVSDVKKRGKP